MTANAIDLTTVDDVAAWLGIASPSQDVQDRLQQLITAASTWMLNRMDRSTMAVHTVIENRDGNDAQQMVFRDFPVLSVSSLTINDTNISAATSTTGSGYRFTPDKIVLNGARFTEGFANVRIVYSAGYATVPFDLAQACIELVSFRWKEKERIGYASKSLAGETVAFITKDVPASVQSTMDEWRRTVPV